MGEHAGKKLERIPFDVAFWKEWKVLYPESRVLSQDTGFGRPYGVDPYGDYYTSPDILFPVSHRDDRLGPKEIVVGLENEGTYRAYELQQIEDDHVVVFVGAIAPQRSNAEDAEIAETDAWRRDASS